MTLKLSFDSHPLVGKKVLVEGQETTEWSAHAVVKKITCDSDGILRITFREFSVVKSWADLSNGLFININYAHNLVISDKEISYESIGGWHRIRPISPSPVF